MRRMVRARRARTLRTRSLSPRFSPVFIPAAGSSSRSSSGSRARARAISSRRWSPYAKLRALLLAPVGEADEGEQLAGALARLALLPPRGAEAEHATDEPAPRPHVPRDHHVVERGQLAEEAHVLERARDAPLGHAVGRQAR